MALKGKIYLSQGGTGPLIVHAVADDLYGIEDGLSILDNPRELLEGISSLWPDKRLLVFRRKSDKRTDDEAIEAQTNWNSIVEQSPMAWFAVLLDRKSKAYDVCQYLRGGYHQEARAVEIYTRNHGRPDPQVSKRVEQGKYYLGLIQDMLDYTRTPEDKSASEALHAWKDVSPVIFRPFFTLHGEGLSLVIPDQDRRDVFNAVREVVERIAASQGFAVECVQDLREKYPLI